MTCSHLREPLTCVKQLQFMSWVDHAPCVYIYICVCVCVLPLAQVQSTMRSLHQADDYRDHQCSSLDWSVAMQWVQMNHIIKVSIWATIVLWSTVEDWYWSVSLFPWLKLDDSSAGIHECGRIWVTVNKWRTTSIHSGKCTRHYQAIWHIPKSDTTGKQVCSPKKIATILGCKGFWHNLHQPCD